MPKQCMSIENFAQHSLSMNKGMLYRCDIRNVAPEHVNNEREQ